MLCEVNMDYITEKKKINNKKLTIGFLDENAYDEYHSQIISGMFEAALKYDMNIIRFGHFGSNTTFKHQFEHNMILNHIEQYDLDGLIFLGWARVANGDNHEKFKKHFNSIPLISLGTGFNDIPCVYFQGDYYLKELLLHLINRHGYKKIAFLSPYWYDNRVKVYIEIMKEYGIYDPSLFISEKELADLDIPQRGRKAVSILLDDRKVSLEAIISLYNAETEGILSELKERGIDVPYDISVTSYEDGNIGKLSTPSFTTIYFPWRELGYSSCEKMFELITNGHIPMTTQVPGKVVIRDSCGCIPSTVHNSKVGKTSIANKPIDQLSKTEYSKLEAEIIKEIDSKDLNISALLAAFFEDLRNCTYVFFPTLLEVQLRKIHLDKLTNIEDSISIFRRHLLPYTLHDKNIFLWSESLFQQAQIILQEMISSTWVYEVIRTRRLNQLLQEIGQHIITNFSVESIFDSLELNLHKLGINSCYIFLFNNPHSEENHFNDYSLAFDYTCKTRNKSNPLAPISVKQKLSEYFDLKNHPFAMMGHLLNFTDNYIGFVLFEPGPLDDGIYQALSLHISTALSGAILLEKLDSSYKKLVDLAHKNGMADFATGILHNVNNVLNTINTCIQVIKTLVGSPPFEDLLKATKLLESNLDDLDSFIMNNTKGKNLMQFYVNLDEPIKNLHSQLLHNINRLNEKVTLVDEIISSQQNYIGIKARKEDLNIVTILEDALKLYQIPIENSNVKIIKKYDDIKNVSVQRTKLFHVIVNLIKNAIEAMMEVPEDKRKLIIAIEQNSHNTFITITDTGTGIAPEMHESIFAFGFTTKKGGHGFGLHSCANYMTEMGGKIWVDSEGLGKGSTFVLQLK